jgi:hypothetical protein
LTSKPWATRRSTSVSRSVNPVRRAFYGDPFGAVLTALQAQGIQLWLPEADGPVNLDDPVHQALMLLLGSQSRREVLQARHRVLAAMHVQARVQAGSSAAGRPTATVSPMPARTRTGPRELGPPPAPPGTRSGHRTMGAVDLRQRATGRSVAGIARELNDRSIPCPSSGDRDRNRHRTRHEWIVRTVVGILRNPDTPGGRCGTGTAPEQPVLPATVLQPPPAARGWAESKNVTYPALTSLGRLPLGTIHWGTR